MVIPNIQKTGGASINPSARRSIHHDDLRPLIERMGHYGLVGESQKARFGTNRNARPIEQDIDEVDNIISKPVHHISPSKTSPLQYDRRNSLQNRCANSSKFQNNEDSIHILSKSLPTSLPSHSYFSESDDEYDLVEENNVYSESSYHSVEHGRSSNSSSHASRNNTVTNGIHNNSNSLNRSGSLRRQTNQDQTKPDLNSWIILIALALVSVVIAIYMYKQKCTPEKGYDESSFYADIKLIGSNYPIRKNDITRIQSGLSTILRNQDTASFIFVYNSNEPQYNEEKFNTFINNVSEIASKYLRNNTPSIKYTMVEGSALNLRGPADLMTLYSQALGHSGVLLVRDMEAVPSHLAMAFHYYCDEYNPLVKNSAIFFTLDLAVCASEDANKYSHSYIEKCLARKWINVPADSIRPLLTRVVNVVIDLTSAF